MSGGSSGGPGEDSCWSDASGVAGNGGAAGGTREGAWSCLCGFGANDALTSECAMCDASRRTAESDLGQGETLPDDGSDEVEMVGTTPPDGSPGQTHEDAAASSPPANVDGHDGAGSRSASDQPTKRTSKPAVLQEATALVIDKALAQSRKQPASDKVPVRESAKKHLKARAQTFLGCLLGRPELAESMDAKNVDKAVDHWIPTSGDVSRLMRSLSSCYFPAAAMKVVRK